METFLIRALQFILAISILVLLHEGGHLFFAKLFGVRVEKFYVFLDISIGKWKGSLFKWCPRNSQTTYGMGWLPLGGYCKISGMIDESFDTEQMAKAPKPWEFRTKPAWQRLLIMIGGVMVNFLLAFAIYAAIMFNWGQTYYKVSDMKMGMRFSAEAKTIGFQDHDIMLGTDQGQFKEYLNVNGDFFRQIAQAKRVDVLRNGKKISITMPGNLDMLAMIKERPLFAEPYIPARIDSVLKDGIAMKAGIRKGDHILALNGKKIETWTDWNYQIGILNDVMTVKKTTRDSLTTRKAVIVVSHTSNHKIDTLRITLDPELKLGVTQSNLASYYQPTVEHYTLLESIPAGFKYGINILGGYVGNFRYLASADGVKSIGGFGSIGGLFPPYWDWYMFLNMTALLSIILASMNILPVPALDGGHVMFLLYEMITRRKPSEKFMVRAEYIGITLLIILMIVANLNDILRWLNVM